MHMFVYILEDHSVTQLFALIKVYQRSRRIHLRRSLKHGGRTSNSLYSPAEKLLTKQTSDVLSTTCWQAFMMPDG